MGRRGRTRGRILRGVTLIFRFEITVKDGGRGNSECEVREGGVTRKGWGEGW